MEIFYKLYNIIDFYTSITFSRFVHLLILLIIVGNIILKESAYFMLTFDCYLITILVNICNLIVSVQVTVFLTRCFNFYLNDCKSHFKS